MSFIITNFKFTGATQYKDIYFSGNYIRILSGHLCLSKSSNIKFRNKFAEDLSSVDVNNEIISDDFYIVADYESNCKEIRIQTDLVAYESGYFFRDSFSFAFSDDIHLLLKILTESGYKISISENKVREFICFGRSLFDDTIFLNIIRLKAASIYRYSLLENTLDCHEYNSFKFSNKVTNAHDAATQLYGTIDTYFKKNKIDGLYGLGLSGGLDSRVAGYFAGKHKYLINPFFIGLKHNRIGLLRNDAKRSFEVAKELNFMSVKFKNPLSIDLQTKLKNDAQYAPLGVPNVAQNIGNECFEFDVLIHGMMGGELFGDLLSNKVSIMNVEELAEYILKKSSHLPLYKYKSTLLVKLLAWIPCTRNNVICNRETYLEVMNEDEYQRCKGRMIDWIKLEKEKGLSNINIFLKEFYYRFSAGVKTGYYSTLEDNFPALGVYMNPCVLRTALEWSDELFQNKIVQYHLVQMLGNLSLIRSQTFRTNANKNKKLNKIMKIYSIFERIIRGGSMVYTDWFTVKEISESEKELALGSKIYDKINLKSNAYRKSGMNAMFVIIKTAVIEKQYNLEVE